MHVLTDPPILYFGTPVVLISTVNPDGHPNLAPLLLAPEFEGHPLRKDFVLAARVAKAWPGAKEPGEREERAPAGPAVGSERRRGQSQAEGVARRAPMRPPGVPAPGEWGPAAQPGEEA